MVVQQTHPKREDSNRVKVIVSPVGRQGRPGTPGVSIRFFDTLQEALDLQPRPENGVTFQVREETDPENFGFYVFDDREPEGYRYLGERWDDEYLNEIENRIDAFEQDVEGQVQGLETRVEGVETDVTGFKTDVNQRIEDVEQGALSKVGDETKIGDLKIVGELKPKATAVNSDYVRSALTVDGDISFASRSTRPLITFWWDDGPKETYDIIYPGLKARGVVAVSSACPGFFGQSSYMTEEQILELHSEGWEIVSETMHHVHLPTLTLSEAETELKDSREYLENLGVETKNLTIPAGLFNSDVLDLVKKYYRGASGGDYAINYSPWPYPINREDMDYHSFSELKPMIDEAIANNGYLIIRGHAQFAPWEDQAKVDDFFAMVDYVIAQGVDIVTYNQAQDIAGNIISVEGNRGDFFRVGADGKVDFPEAKRVQINTELSSPNAATPLEDYTKNTISYEYGPGGGFPTASGVLATYSIDKYKRYDRQFWYDRTNPGLIYQRWWSEPTSDWGEWKRVSSSHHSNNINTHLITDPISSYDYGVSVEANSDSGAPTVNGMLVTYRLEGNPQYDRQVWYDRVDTTLVYQRRWDPSNGWGDWDMISSAFHNIKINTHSSTDPISSFNQGVSVEPGTGAGAGWPTGSGVVTTYRLDGFDLYHRQFWYDRTNPTLIFQRWWDNPNNQWGDWKQVSTALHNTTYNTHTATDPIGAYDPGVSVEPNNGSGWPTGFGVAVTYRLKGNQQYDRQFWYDRTDASKSYQRWWDNGNSQWGEWIQISGGASGSYTSQDGKTVTVENGLITSIE